jgi:hypothetical protein
MLILCFCLVLMLVNTHLVFMEEKEKKDISVDIKGHIDRDVIEFIVNLSREDLIPTAYTLEIYHRKINHQEGLMGGLHDYVFSISDDQIRNYVFKELIEHPEISQINTIKMMTEATKATTEKLRKYGREFLVGEGIHDYLRAAPRDKLESLAFAVEKYHQKIREEFLFGGLHDYITQISDDDLRSYIAKETNEHNEINNVKALEELINVRNEDFLKNYVKDEVSNLLKNADRNQLMKMLNIIMTKIKMSAIEVDAINHQMNLKTDDELRNYIRNRINLFPDQLNNIELYNN